MAFFLSSKVLGKPPFRGKAPFFLPFCRIGIYTKNFTLPHSVKDKIDLSTAQGKMYFQLLSILAEFELETIKVRLLEVRLAKMRKKEIFPCKRPYGYTWNDVSK